MNLNTIVEVKRPHSVEQLDWREGHAWLAGGTWLFSNRCLNEVPDIMPVGWHAAAEPLWIFQLQLRGLSGTQCPWAYKCVWEPEEDAFKGLLGLVLARKQESACRSPGPRGSRSRAPRLPSMLLQPLGEPSAVQKV